MYSINEQKKTSLFNFCGFSWARNGLTTLLAVLDNRSIGVFVAQVQLLSGPVSPSVETPGSIKTFPLICNMQSFFL